MNKNDFEYKVELLLNKLDNLNERIVFYYYTKYKNGGFKKYIDIKNNFISLKNYFNKKKGITKDDINRRIKLDFPYYYKMTKLYAHLCAILDIMELNFNKKFVEISHSLIEDFLNPSVIAHETYENISADAMEYLLLTNIGEEKREKINKETKILMRNANFLHNDLNKYGDNESKFRYEVTLEDYSYIYEEYRKTEKWINEFKKQHFTETQKNNQSSRKYMGVDWASGDINDISYVHSLIRTNDNDDSSQLKTIKNIWYGNTESLLQETPSEKLPQMGPNVNEDSMKKILEALRKND